MRRAAPALLWLFAAWAVPPAMAGRLTVTVDDGRGHPVADAVVMLRPGAATPAAPPAARAGRQVVDQRDLAFVPYLEVFRPGDEVVFRNSDRTRHHVYSFSPVKSFEFVLAPNQSSPPLRLDRTGAIAVGCNIHDQMIAYLYVTDAPWFAQTGASGKAAFDLPAGDYEVRVWQPRLRPGRAEPARMLSLAAGAAPAALSVPLPLLPDPRLQFGRELMHY